MAHSSPSVHHLIAHVVTPLEWLSPSQGCETLFPSLRPSVRPWKFRPRPTFIISAEATAPGVWTATPGALYLYAPHLHFTRERRIINQLCILKRATVITTRESHTEFNLHFGIPHFLLFLPHLILKPLLCHGMSLLSIALPPALHSHHSVRPLAIRLIAMDLCLTSPPLPSTDQTAVLYYK